MLNLKIEPLHLDAFIGLHALRCINFFFLDILNITLKRIKKRDCFYEVTLIIIYSIVKNLRFQIL